MRHPLGTWASPLSDFLKSPEFKNIGKLLKNEIDLGKPVMPQQSYQIFEAFKLCPWDKVKVVILTNNPYLGYETDGLALSAKGAIWGPTPVLSKIFQAINESCFNGIPVKHSNDLGMWAMQGILLLNCDITSVRDKRGAHIELWKPFIKATIQALNKKPGLIFCLIGNEAKKYKEFLDEDVEVQLLEHPMQSVVEKRDWKHNDIFNYISNYTDFMFNKPIIWN